MQIINKMITQSRTIAVVSHTNPDGDTVGCAMAMALVLTQLGKDVCVVCDTALPQDMSALPSAGIFAMGVIDKSYDLVLCVDCASIGMLGQAAVTLAKGKHTACIDHHRDHSVFTQRDVVVPAAANTENVFDFLTAYYPQYITLDVAECLYTGLVTDSGGFTYDSVTPHTHEVAAACLRLGVNGEKICTKQLKSLPLRTIRLRAEAYQKALYAYANTVVIAVFSQAMMRRLGATIEDTNGSLVDMMRADEIVLGIAAVEIEPEHYKISVRSKGDVSASLLCNRFGGGGHFHAAGCRLNGCEGVVIDLLLEAVDAIL